ncbi:hypothetical protein BIV57_14995 [Mangrovactinospora gilvigrisea]|uniref:Aminoglycoside phosphotransferase n=2 Tax=Mangrovactinospora gilvigrisea TaxID=1428644 RepID=A0A1J7BDD9_9ACTN|nr:hypothetical protein BIV57_14995 [Mangrovactinospora gilvigrisea]
MVRVGDTVRRPAGPHTPAVDALLAHLHAVGFAGAPRPLGRDERGRQVLEFVPGTCPYPADPGGVLASDAGLARVARLIREFHDAVGGFVPPPDAVWDPLWGDRGAEIVAHHDLAAWNLVVDDGQRGDGRWVFVDWDGAAPATRLWDLAWAVNSFAPMAEAWDGGDVPPERAARRLRVFADAYRLDGEDDRRALAALLPVRTGAMREVLREGARTGAQPWARLDAEGHGDAWARMTDRLEEGRERWLAALLG